MFGRCRLLKRYRDCRQCNDRSVKERIPQPGLVTNPETRNKNSLSTVKKVQLQILLSRRLRKKWVRWSYSYSLSVTYTFLIVLSQKESIAYEIGEMSTEPISVPLKDKERDRQELDSER